MKRNSRFILDRWGFFPNGRRHQLIVHISGTVSYLWLVLQIFLKKHSHPDFAWILHVYVSTWKEMWIPLRSFSHKNLLAWFISQGLKFGHLAWRSISDRWFHSLVANDYIPWSIILGYFLFFDIDVIWTLFYWYTKIIQHQYSSYISNLSATDRNCRSAFKVS